MIRPTCARLLALLALLHLHSGCQSPESEQAADLLKGSSIGKVTQLQLREELKDFADRFAYTIGSAANEIQSESSDPAMCVRAVYWQLFTIPSCRKSAVSQNPIAALVDVWAFCKQLERYFDEHEVFGERTQLARDVSRELEGDITNIAADIIPERFFEDVEKGVDNFVTEHPIAGTFARRSLRPAMVKASDAKSLMWVADLPLAPFRIFMDEHAKAIREFTLVADNMVTYAQSIPNVFRWQTQLLLYDLETRDTTTSLVSSFKAAADGVESLVKVAEELPEEIGRELNSTLDAAEAKQAGLRETLKEVQTTLTAADETLANAKTVALTLEKTTGNWNEAGTRWEKAVNAADVLVSRFTDEEETTDVAPPPEEEGGFDIKEYTETAVRAEAAAARLQALTSEARGLLESDAAGALVDKVVWSGVFLIAAFFGSLLVYRIVVTRLASTPPKAENPTSTRADALKTRASQSS